MAVTWVIPGRQLEFLNLEEARGPRWREARGARANFVEREVLHSIDVSEIPRARRHYHQHGQSLPTTKACADVTPPIIPECLRIRRRAASRSQFVRRRLNRVDAYR